MENEVYAVWGGPIVVIGFGSIAQGLLPLLSRHISFSDNQLYFIEPKEKRLLQIGRPDAHLINVALTRGNYKTTLDAIIKATGQQSLIINVSVDVSSVDIIKYAQHTNSLYIDTVIEPWANHYTNFSLPTVERTNYHLREELLQLRKSLPKGPTAVSCCGANPGMVSWLVKEALMNLANDLEKKVREPETQAGWAELMQELGVQGIHIAEKDSQTSITKKSASEFINTWSVEGMIAESIQPAELGWGTHEEQLPKNAHTHVGGSKCAIYLDTPGGQTKLRSWVPSGPQEAYLITHNEAISISEYFTVRDSEGSVVYRPTCNYAYHPTADTIQSLAEMFDKPTAHIEHTILAAENIATGSDELGVLLYGHKKNAYWYGSKLTIEETRKLAPHQNATGLQVTSAVLSGIVWMITYPTKGIVEVEEIDYKMCLNLQRKYLGSVSGVYTDWYPNNTMKESLPEEKRWQFSNIKM